MASKPFQTVCTQRKDTASRVVNKIITAQKLSGTENSPRHEFTKPYHTHPSSPISQRPCVLAAKLNGVPRTHTSRSLKEMLTSRQLMGERSILYRQNRMRTIKLLRKPKVPIKPRHTATTRCPVALKVCSEEVPSKWPSPHHALPDLVQLRLTLDTIILIGFRP